MLVQRFSWKAKTGCRAEVIKLVKAAVEETGVTPRVWTYMFGAYDMVFSDYEFESEEDRKEFWAGVNWSQPAIAEWYKIQPDLVESHWIELLRVH